MPHWSASPHPLYTAPRSTSNVLDPFGINASLSRAAEKEEKERIDKLWWIKEVERLTREAPPGSHEMGYIPKSVLQWKMSDDWDAWIPWMSEDTTELAKKVIKTGDKTAEVEACVWGASDPCRMVIYHSQLERLLDTSRCIDDTLILASLKALEASHHDVYTVDSLRLAENIESWPDASAWAKMVEKDLTKDVFKAKRYIFLPWNTPRNSSVYPGHWSLLVLEPRTFRIRMFDNLFPKEPCPPGLETWAKDTVSRWSGTHGKGWQFVVSHAAQQTDSTASGAYVCAHAHALVNQKNVKTVRKGVPTGDFASVVLRKFMLATVFTHGKTWPAQEPSGPDTYRDRVRGVKRENESFQ